MRGERPSLPPGDESLRQMTARLTARNDEHEAELAKVSAITDKDRLAVVREIWAYWIKDKATHLDQALIRYEAEAKVRLEMAVGKVEK